jgi:hypothetical protein
VARRGGGVSEGEGVGGYRVLGPLCVIVSISAIVVEGAYVRDCKGMGMCTVGTVG